MRLFLLSLIVLFISGCMQTPEHPPSKKTAAQDQIKSNQTEAEKAKAEYSRLRKQRSSE